MIYYIAPGMETSKVTNKNFIRTKGIIGTPNGKRFTLQIQTTKKPITKRLMK